MHSVSVSNVRLMMPNLNGVAKHPGLSLRLTAGPIDVDPVISRPIDTFDVNYVPSFCTARLLCSTIATRNF